jgi:hypothetical protein
MAQNLQKGATYKSLDQSLDPRTTTLRQIVEAYGDTLTQEGAKSFKGAFTGKTQFAPIFKDYLDRPAVDFVETFSDDEANPLIQAYEKNEKVNARRGIYSQIGAIEFTINDQLKKAGALVELYPEGMPMATDRVTRPDKPKAKARRYSYNPGLLGEWLVKLDEYGKKNPQDVGIVKALEAQMHMGLRPGEIMNAPASALRPPEKRSASWGFFLDTDTPGVKMDENLNIAVGPRTYNIMQQALAVSPANDRNLFVNPDGSPIGKGEMTRVIKQIKVPGIMTDELTGQKLDALQEAYDARRMWVTLALNEFPGEGNRVGAAQGRAVGAVTKGGGAVKEYYSPSPGFYSKAATTVPDTIDSWLFEARTDELPERMQPPEGQRISFATDFTGPQLSPVFEPKDAPIKVGDLEARFIEPAPKTEVIRPEAAAPATPAVPQPTTAPASVDEAYPGMAEKAAAKGVDLDKLLNGIADRLPGPVKKAFGPLMIGATTAAAVATQTKVSEAAEQAGVPKPLAEAAGTVAGASEFAPITYSDVEAMAKGRQDPDLFGVTPASRIAAEEEMNPGSTGFVEQGVPEAAPAEQQGFLSR